MRSAQAGYASGLWLPGLAIAAGRRRLDDDRLAGIDHGRVRALQPLHPSILAAHPILADLTSLAAGEPERPHAAMARQDRAFHLFQEPDGAPDAVAGVPLAASARVLADMEILQHDRIEELHVLGAV